MVSLHRRQFFALGAGGVALAAAQPLSAHGHGAAATDAAAFYKFKLGEIDAIAVSDGRLNIGPLAGSAPNAPADEVAALAAANRLPTEELVVQATCLVLKLSDGWALFDVGSGGDFQKTAGKLVATLAAAGVEPADVAHVILTHAHPDHAWGLTADGKTVFPNAQISIGDAEFAFWTNAETRGKFPESYRFLVDGAQAALKPFMDGVKRLGDGDTVAPGVTAVAAAGHTPGHMAYRIESGGQTLLLTGDVATHPVLSLARPDWGFSFDIDKAAAAATRKSVLAMVAADQTPILSYHFPFPGAGYVIADGSAYRFAPTSL